MLPTRLWERWSKRESGACPYGIILRPAADAETPEPPFESWSYRPSYMPPGISIEGARGTPLSGPELLFLAFQRGTARSGQEPRDHLLPVRALTGVTVWRPSDGASVAATALEAAGLVAFRDGDEPLLELRFGSASRGSADLRPTLPLRLAW